MEEGGALTLVGRVVVLDTALHILQLVQDCKHVDELAQGQEVISESKVLPPSGMALLCRSPHCRTARWLLRCGQRGGGSGLGSLVGRLAEPPCWELVKAFPWGLYSEPGLLEKGKTA